MDKKSKPITKKDKMKFNPEPGFILLLIFFVFIGMLVEKTGVSLFIPLIFWLFALIVYKQGRIFGIHDNEKARRWAVYLAIAGVFLFFWEFRVCC
ncbi:MAG: hypothetical protein Sv326_0512 [Candidatus Fermentimicrarchaeum limneticum]|uniref:Uncharacterized protein n=1 Tax=Fermentimicrarchaeum limneticum TaxID=2795018 RepID=A0A7D5XPM4_FERL1|nr:MAG: hypothetical protein Sv326_0512 [Candidatus Fermentimicrarchaeum limneticum]